MKKTRPCLVVSPDEMNRHLRTVQIAPMTSTLREYPWRVPITFRRKKRYVALDQIRAVDQSRLIKRAGKASVEVVDQVKKVIHEMLVA